MHRDDNQTSRVLRVHFQVLAGSCSAVHTNRTAWQCSCSASSCEACALILSQLPNARGVTCRAIMAALLLGASKMESVRQYYPIFRVSPPILAQKIQQLTCLNSRRMQQQATLLKGHPEPGAVTDERRRVRLTPRRHAEELVGAHLVLLAHEHRAITRPVFACKCSRPSVSRRSP